ncbi:MAG: hypothetical protein AAGD14_13730 [Planctomycetota bacterium]
MPEATVHEDLRYIREVLTRTQARIDPHAFHFVLWGGLVLVAYPLLNWFELGGDLAAMAWTGGVALALGTLGSTIFEMRLSGKPRLEGENTFVAGQVVRIVFMNVALGVVLTAIGLVPPEAIPLIWGFVYANMAYMVGVVYMPEYRWSGIVIAAATLLAWFQADYRGFILGPAMGLGMIVPGVMAERRVARLRNEAA